MIGKILIKSWRRWQRTRATRRELMALDDKQLSDIGIERRDIDRIARRTLASPAS